MAIEREIRFLVTRGEPPRAGLAHAQAYLLRRPALRIRLQEDGLAWLTLKLARSEGGGSRREWECRLPAPLARLLLRLPFPRVEKTRQRLGELIVDRVRWPRPMVLCEYELRPECTLDVSDPEARAAFMEARRPPWVESWHDITDDPGLTAAALARRRPGLRHDPLGPQ